MSEPNPEILVDLRDKTHVNYAQILLLGINDVRFTFARGGDPGPAIDGLFDILPPEIKELLIPGINKFAKSYCRRVQKAKYADFSIRAQQLRAVWLNYCHRRFTLIVNTLDENGLLREFRKEEIGGL